MFHFRCGFLCNNLIRLFLLLSFLDGNECLGNNGIDKIGIENYLSDEIKLSFVKKDNFLGKKNFLLKKKIIEFLPTF